MKIDGFSPVRNNKTEKKKKSSSTGGGFSSYLNVGETDSAGASAPVEPSTSVAGVSNVLSLQEVGEEETNKKQAMQAGELTLQSLEQLRNALLLGEVPVHVLSNVQSRMEAQKRMTSDPLLLEILKEIEVRAAVELAKFERYQQGT
jgi:hypothetical protein